MTPGGSEERKEPELILVVDDDAEIRRLIAEFLRSHGFRVASAGSGPEMDACLRGATPDLVVLDLMLPGEDGLTICRRLAAHAGPPVIMLSALGEDTDRIVGLELGADDYLSKPCNPRELLARIRAVLRRRRGLPEPALERGSAYHFSGWVFDLVRRELRSRAGTVVALSSGEFHLLRVLAERPLRILTRDQLLDLTRGDVAEVFDRAIDVQISRLRKKLASSSGEEIIQTVRNEGYMFSARPTLK